MSSTGGVLVTGFGPYLGPVNASQELVRSLEEDPPASLDDLPGGLATRILPVDTEAAPVLLRETLEVLRPRLCLLLGQAPGRTRVEIERVARNQRRFTMPDVKGRVVEGAPVVPGGPESYSTTLLDPQGAVNRLRGLELPAGLSEDAGLYLCNQVYYLALHQTASWEEAVQVAFVHVPLLPSQRRPEDPPEACLPLPLQRRALVELVRTCDAAGSLPWAPGPSPV